MRTRNIFISVILVTASVALNAQTASLDIHRALELAQTDNLELKAARQQRAIAIAGIQIAKQYLNPNITFGITRDAPHESLAVGQSFEIGGQRNKRIAVAKEEQKSTDIDIAALERSIRHRTRDAFFRVVAARSQSEQAKSALELATKLKDAAQQRFDAGDVAQLDVMAADVEQARAQAEFETISQEVRSAEALLNALLGRNPEESLSLEGDLKYVSPVDTLASHTAKALIANSAVQQVAQDLNTEEKRLILVKASRIPNVDLQVNTAFNNPPNYRAALGGQIGMSMPLFYHGQGEIAQSSARLELLRLTFSALKLNASAQVAAAYYDFMAKSNQAKQYTLKILPQTEKLAAMAEESYKAGKTNLLTLIDAQRKLNEVRRGQVDSQLAMQAAFATLEEAVGMPLDR